MKLYIETNDRAVSPRAITSDDHSIIWINHICNTITVTAANRDEIPSFFATIYDFKDLITLTVGKYKKDFVSFKIGPRERGYKR
jgi:hypothetical protein